MNTINEQLLAKKKNSRWAIRPLVPEEVYADREEHNEDVTLPWRFIYIRHRTRLGAAREMEIDVEAAAAKEHWICESKWWHGRKVSHVEVESLLRKAEALREAEGEGLETMRVWFFAHDGFTDKAEELMKKNGVLWSVREELNGLLESVSG